MSSRAHTSRLTSSLPGSKLGSELAVARDRMPATSTGKAVRATPFMGMILEAVKGVKQDVLQRKSVLGRLRRGAELSVVLVREVSGLFLAVPYGVHALSVYRSLERISPGEKTAVQDAATKVGHEDKLVTIVLWLVSTLLRTLLLTLKVLLGEAAPQVTTIQLKDRLRDVRLVEDIRYGKAERDVLDVYIPVEASTADAASGSPILEPQDCTVDGREGATILGSASVQASELKGKPVLLFVHGGVWASGEKWQYAPMAVKCAQGGVVVVSMQYTLYPEALSCSQAKEVSKALTWVFDNIDRFGGDPGRVFLAGHSSGAHICALAIWERACAQLRSDIIQNLEAAGVKTEVAARATTASRQPSSGPAKVPSEGSLGSMATSNESALAVDMRQPHCFLGLSGVFDIAQHLAHEMKRGVDIISCMARANGGTQGFAERSPALLLAALSALSPSLEKGPSPDASNGQSGASATAAWAGAQSSGSTAAPLGFRAYESSASANLKEKLNMSATDLQSLAAAFGCAVEEHPGPACKSTALKRSLSGKLAPLLFSDTGVLESGPVDVSDVLERSQAHTRLLFPRSVLTCSPGDIVVPPDTSLSYAAALHSLGMPCEVLVYDRVSHSDFACWSVDWSSSEIPAHVHDMLSILTHD